MEHKQSSTVEKFEKFTWKIENFSRLNTTEDVCSEPFVLGGYPWRIIFYQWGDNADNLSIYLSAVKTANMSIGWRRLVKFRLFLFNQFHSNRTITHESEREFNARFSIWGFDAIVSSTELLNPHRGFLVKGACIFGAEVSFCESNYEKQVTQKNSKTVHKEVGVIRSKLGEGPGQNLGELMHFKGLGQIEKAFIPLLEEVCSQHPSLIACQQKRSRKFSEWAFTALGRVLYFLKTKKVKDMDDLACKDLQIFWEELQSFGFDLTWLEPHVQSALGMKNYLKKVKEVKKLKKKVVALELEMETLKAKMVTVEVNLFAARDLLKAKDFLERDLDAELGY